MRNFYLPFLLTATVALSTPLTGWGQISITAFNTPFSQDFNTLALTGTSSSLPAGWAFLEAGANANATYAAGAGSGNSGDTYSFGVAAASERAFGGLRSGSLITTLGVAYTNNTGNTINSITIAYTGEQWRLGMTGRRDSLDFQYSTDATNLSTGTWTDVNALDFKAPIASGTAGLLDGNAMANRTAITFTITGLSISNGSTFRFRWNDPDVTGSDDGLAIDDFSLTVVCPAISAVISGDAAFCAESNFGNVGRVTITGGTGPYTVVYTDGTNNYTATMYVSGTLLPGPAVYGTTTFTLVSVTDANSCTAATLSGSGMMTQSTNDIVIEAALTQPTCAALSGGAIDITPGGGISPYTYQWSGGSMSTMQDISGLSAGTYTVVVTDAGGCEATEAYILDAPTGCPTFACPTIGSSSGPGFWCNPGSITISVGSLSKMAATQNGSTDFGIKFVYFSAATTDPYTGGTELGTVPFASLTSVGTLATLVVNTASMPPVGNNYFWYAILTPTPGEATCRPSGGGFSFNVVASPTVFNVTGGGAVCGTTGVPIGLSGSQSGYQYRLFRDVSTSVATLTGNGNTLDFGTFTTAGTYTVVTTDNTGATCTATMNGSAVVTLSTPPSITPSLTLPTCTVVGSISFAEATGGTFTYVFSTGGSGFTGPGTAVTPSGGTVSIPLAAGEQSATTYWIRVTNTAVTPSCSADFSVAKAAVTGCCPTVGAGPDVSICSNGIATLSATGAGGSWTGGAGTFTPDRNTPNATYTAAAGEIGTTVTLTWGIPAAGGCALSSDNVDIQVKSVVTCSGSAPWSGN